LPKLGEWWCDVCVAVEIFFCKMCCVFPAGLFRKPKEDHPAVSQMDLVYEENLVPDC